MKDVLEAFDHPLDGFDVMDIDDHDWFGSTIVIDANKVKQATDEINQTFKILSDRSQDLK
jgi:hypothetical protein